MTAFLVLIALYTMSNGSNSTRLELSRSLPENIVSDNRLHGAHALSGFLFVLGSDNVKINIRRRAELFVIPFSDATFILRILFWHRE